MKNRIFLSILTVAVAACASRRETETVVFASPAPAPLAPAMNPVGTFDFTTITQGMTVTGSISVIPTTSGYGGTITTSLTDPIAISRVFVEGQTLRVLADTPDGPLDMTLRFVGNEFTGGWIMQGGAVTGELRGKRRY